MPGRVDAPLTRNAGDRCRGAGSDVRADSLGGRSPLTRRSPTRGTEPSLSQTGTRMIPCFAALFLISFSTLLVELAMTRVLDVILTSNMSYLILTSAIFAFGLAGIVNTLGSAGKERSGLPTARIALLFSLSIAVILPAFNVIPFDFDDLTDDLVKQLISFGLMYVVLFLPFFLSGLMIIRIFAAFPSRIQVLYFFDLVGAAVGCVAVVPFVPLIGPGGILFLASALAMVTAAVFTRRKIRAVAMAAAAVLLAILPFQKRPAYYDFHEHTDKRGVRYAREHSRIERTVWDPVSKIDVLEYDETRKHIAYDGGTQSSTITRFDGNLEKLRSRIDRYIDADTKDSSSGDNIIRRHFWFAGVLAAHYLKRDSGQEVLIIGSAGGQETKAALVYGAKSVDAVEMVGAVMDLGRRRYADYNGNIFNNPRVHPRVDEGRSFLRSSGKKYDIIQIFSNHTSSSIASGTGAVATTYLQTSDAYREYFSHLKEDGILQVNHHIFPKMITTAALGWKSMGRTGFRDHVVVYVRKDRNDTLPTFLVKMTPWTASEMSDLARLFEGDRPADSDRFELVENPLDQDGSYLSDEFYSGDFPRELAATIPYRVSPSTDDRPYFNTLRKRFGVMSEDGRNFVDHSTAMILNSQLRKGIPMDVAHLFLLGAVSVVAAFAFIFVPLFGSKAGRTGWERKNSSLAYFSCLGAGFIILEVVYIQLFMRFIGPPLHTFSTVVFSLLFAAGTGSYFSKGLRVDSPGRWPWPFLAIIGYGLLLLLLGPGLFDLFLGADRGVRIGISFLLLFPIGFFLGMPFPMGILFLEKKPAGAIAWAWGMNGLFTVVGGLACMGVSIFYGFRATLLMALAIYALALVLYSRLRGSGA